jgi:superfamily II DNA or RNA helicase
MVKLTIFNSHCQVAGLSPELDKRLKEELRYTNQAVSYTYHSNLREIARIRAILSNPSMKTDGSLEGRLKMLEGQNRGLFRDLFKVLFKNGEFPTGLLPKFMSIVSGAGQEVQVSDQRKQPAKKQLKFVLAHTFPPMRYYQRGMSQIAMEKGRGICVAPTGTGKTLTVAKMIWEMGVKTLIITPNKAITDNMVDTLTHYFSKSKVAKLNTKSVKTKAINVVNIQALIKLDPMVLKGIDMVIIDEFHHAAAATYLEVNQRHLKDVYYRIGLTATNFRNDGADLALESVLSEVLYEYSIKQAIEDGFLVKPEFEVVPMFHDGRSNYQDEYKECLVENDERNGVIAEIVEHHKTDSVIVLVQHIEHGERLEKLIPGSKFIHGEEKDDVRQNAMEDFRKGKLRCLIGSSVIGEGVDLPRANVLVLAGGGKARSTVMQQVGRVLRPFEGKTKAVVYDFSDEGATYLEEHSILRQEIFQAYA